jgi:hypothetical protein
MYLSCITIHIQDENLVMLDRENFIRYHVQDPNQPMNASVNIIDEYLSNHAILTFSMAPDFMETKDEVWNKTHHLEEMNNKPLGGYYEQGISTLDHIADFFHLIIGNKKIQLYS